MPDLTYCDACRRLAAYCYCAQTVADIDRWADGDLETGRAQAYYAKLEQQARLALDAIGEQVWATPPCEALTLEELEEALEARERGEFINGNGPNVE